MVNGNMKTIFGVLLIIIYRCNIAFSVSDSLPLVQLKYSLNSFCSQPETSDVLNRLATSILSHEM